MRISYLHYLTADDTALVHVHEFTAAARALGAGVTVHGMNLAPGPTDDGAEPSLPLRLGHQLQRGLAWALHEPTELLWNPLYARREIELTRRDRPDVLLVRSHPLTASCIAVTRATGVPLVLDVTSPASEPESRSDQHLRIPVVHEWLETWRLQWADRVLVVSDTLGRHLVDRHGVSPEKVVVVQRGADVSRFHATAVPDPETNARFGGAPRVGSVGSFQKRREVDLLASMLLAVGATRPEVRFLLVGDGPELARLRASVGPLGDRVHFTGAVPHERVPALLTCLDVAVLAEAASYRAPLGLLEWMAAGRAIVAAARPAVCEILCDGRTGRLFPPQDAEALVQAVLEVLARPELGRSLGEAAARHVRTEFTWQQNAARVLEVCRDAVALRPAARAA